LVSLPFAKPGRFYRGNLHCHSTNSDGRLAPEAVVAAYREQGYDFIALTDHFLERFGFAVTDTRPFRNAGFTTLFGAELHGPALANGEAWHLVAVGLPLGFAPAGDGEPGPALAARASAAGAFVGIAHPAWHGVSPEDAEAVATADAVEVFNSGHTRDSDRGDGWYLADLLAARGRRVFAYAADDAHFREARPDSFANWVQVRAAVLEPEILLAALKTGDFYSSQGPEIHDVAIDSEQGRITVTCSPAAAIHVVGRGAVNRYARAEGITEAEFPLAPFAAHYFRVTVVDADGKRAWTNPVWLDEEGPIG
jgi:hypothetical protein